MPHRPVTPRAAVALVAALGAFALFAFVRAPWPDDWDGIGFVRALARFDLAHFRPHPPGYPGYVAVSWLLAHVTGSAVDGCTLASALGGALVVGACAWLVRDQVAALAVLPLVALQPIVAWCATGVGADALAVGWLACAMASRGDPLAGALTGLALATRPSLLPTVLVAWGARAVIERRVAWRAGAIALAVVLACYVPVCVHEGAGNVWALSLAQARGHFGAWGNTAVTGTGALERLAVLAHRLRVQGLGATNVVRGGVLVALFAAGTRATEPRVRAVLAVALGSEFAVVLLAQNVDAARHVLALVVAVGTVTAVGAGALARTRRGAVLVCAAVASAVIASPTAHWIDVRRTVPPPGLAMARATLRQPGAVVFGGRDARFGELVGAAVAPCTMAGEVDTVLARLDRVPRTVVVTGDVRFGGPGAARGAWLGEWCREGALPAGGGCVSAWGYRAGGR